MKISDLHGNPKNPRKITDEQLKALSSSLETFGGVWHINEMKNGVEIKPVPNFDGYFCSEDGRIYSVLTTGKKRLPQPRELKQKEDRAGYLQVTFYKNKLRKDLRSHQVIATTWVGPKQDGLVINHKDGNRKNNYSKNLEWVTQTENERHARKVLGKRLLGEKASRSKLKEKDILRIRLLFAGGVSISRIAKTFEISTSQAYRITSRKNWSHI